MAAPRGSGRRGTEDAWELAWLERYPPRNDRPAARRSRPRGFDPARKVLLVTAVLGLTASSFAIAQTSGNDPGVRQAAGEGDPIELGTRNPPSSASTRETAIVANRGNSGLAVRPSNTAKGGRAISATCDNDGAAAEDGCAVYVNKGTGAAASFRTQGSVPFALRETNTGLVQFLNADMVDGKQASEFLGKTEKAADSEQLDGRNSSDFLGKTEKAADSEQLDGRDSATFARFAGRIAPTGSPDLGTPGAGGFTSSKTGTGAYLISFPEGTFPPGAGGTCAFPTPVVLPFAGNAFTATSNGASCSSNGSGSVNIQIWNQADALTDAGFTFIVY